MRTTCTFVLASLLAIRILGSAHAQDRLPGNAPSTFKEHSFKASNGETLRYSLFVPKDLPKDKKLPLVVCLHGAGGGTHAARVLSESEQQMKRPCFLLAPACDGKGTRWVKTEFRGGKGRVVEPELMETIDELLRKHAIDPSRLYVTGQSMGGVGTWGLIAAHPRRFAAAVPVCGLWDPADAPKMKEVPIWAFHGAKDNAVPVSGSREMIEALRKLGARPKYTEYPDLAHGVWGEAYGSEELWEWVFAQRRESQPGADKPAAQNKELARSPRQVAEQLAAVYGKKLDQVAYIPALPLVAKLRLSELTREPKFAEEVDGIVAPFLRGEKSPVPKSGSDQAGHLIFAELAKRSKGKDRERWTLLCRNAANQIFDKDGKPMAIMPYHNEMSDAVFMAGPILAATGKLTGERKYFDAADTHFASMRKLCLRGDGIYRHSPLCEAAWGRGNGFPALGLALALSDWPDDHAARKDLIAEFKKHMAALKPHQDARTGCWHQVIDHPESYDEYSCTCMIGFAMQRGIRLGWLDKAAYQPCVDLAWRAIKERTSPDGKLVNVCSGTGKQKTLRDYFERPAINGRDDRGGAMGLLFATELMAAEQRAP